MSLSNGSTGLELAWHLHRQLTGFSPLSIPVDIVGGAPVQIGRLTPYDKRGRFNEIPKV